MSDYRRRELNAWLQAIQQSLDAKSKPPADRSVEVFIGPGCFSLDEDWFCPIGEGAVAISLYHLKGEAQVGRRGIYLFVSIEEANCWLSEHIESLSIPEKFDDFCKE